MKKLCFLGIFAALTFVLNGCSRPTLNLESDETYRKSLTEVRASLETEKEREVLSEVLQNLRAWRSPEHRELMDQPTLTPAQKEHLDELELQHKIEVYEMLHGKDVDAIARAYKELLISNMENWTSRLESEKERYKEVARIEVKVVELPDYRQLARGMEFRSRNVKLTLQNESARTVDGSSFISIECSCASNGCPDNAALSFVAVQVEEELGPRRKVELEAYQVARDKSEEGLSGVEPEALDCRLTSVTLSGRSILGEPETIYLSDSPEEEISKVDNRIQEHEGRLQKLRAMQFDFKALIAHFEEAEQQQEDLKRQLAGEDAS